MDDKKLRMFSFLGSPSSRARATAGMIHLGDKLGLYEALRAAGAPVHSDELARRAGLHERWVREWAYNQAAAWIIDCDDEERFSLSDEAAAVPPTPDHPAYGMGMFHRFPNTMDTLRAMPEASVPGTGTTTTAMVPKPRLVSSGRSNRGTGRTCCRWCCPRSTASPSRSPRARPRRMSAAARGEPCC